MKTVFAIEGLDRLGKSTLIEGIKNQLGFYQVIHFSKPEKLDWYTNECTIDKVSGIPATSTPQFLYQLESFKNSMILAKSGARLIYDRWHLGEAVYAPLYRGYPGDYVFGLEQRMEMGAVNDIRLILLTEDFNRSKHFVSDGESFDDTKRRDEQELFIKAFNKSIIKDKRIICVTDLNGNYRNKNEILKEALK